MGSTGKEVDTLLTQGLKTRLKIQQLQPQGKANAKNQQTSQSPLSTFARNLQGALDQRSSVKSLRTFVAGEFEDPGELALVDFSSNNILSWNETSLLRDEFYAQLASHPKFTVGSGGTRLMDGNYTYLETTENEIAAFHKAETGLIMNSGYEANVAIWGSIPRPGDIMVHDSLVHSSTHEGMARSLSVNKIEFKHGNMESYKQVLTQILDEFPLVKQGKRSVLVAIESVYSMDGDVCPLKDMIDFADELYTHKNVEFVVDEAHSSGLFGPGGAGLVVALGLEKRCAVRIHTFGKSVGASGAIVLGNEAIRSALINFNPQTIFSTAPSFPMVAGIKAGYNLIMSEKGEKARNDLQHVARMIFSELTSHPNWPLVLEEGLLSVPLAGDDRDPGYNPEYAEWWESRPFLTHIVTLRPRPEHLYWLYFHCLDAGYRVWAIEYPIVELNKARVTIRLHANNTDEQVRGVVAAIYDWVDEVRALEHKQKKSGESGKGDVKVTKSAKRVYDWMRSEGLDGFGMP
ncbi:pyridoxal phosphate-dependent transferase [Rhypophila decipiens]|uniref:Pyridoxal phosphate-dependent transferase n=1 Tax=Rhypophila decipiens TaxID=261697 RepID=A0AAN7B1H2_9PEZI|nr:pyridoxal phosphate-dependent transferase [Rhypophila decipiens]